MIIRFHHLNTLSGLDTLACLQQDYWLHCHLLVIYFRIQRSKGWTPGKRVRSFVFRFDRRIRSQLKTRRYSTFTVSHHCCYEVVGTCNSFYLLSDGSRDLTLDCYVNTQLYMPMLEGHLTSVNFKIRDNNTALAYLNASPGF
jgi:hypothetical protein